MGWDGMGWDGMGWDGMGWDTDRLILRGANVAVICLRLKLNNKDYKCAQQMPVNFLYLYRKLVLYTKAQ